MTYNGHVENGKVVFDEPAPLPDGTRVRVEVATTLPETGPEEKEAPTLAERLASVIGRAEGLPEDWSEQHDYYLREEHRE